MLSDEIAGLRETHISSLLWESAGLTCPCRSQSHEHEYEERPDPALLALILMIEESAQSDAGCWHIVGVHNIEMNEHCTY